MPQNDLDLHLIVDDEIELTGVRLEDAEPIFAVVDADRAHLSTWLPWVRSTKSSADTTAFLEIVTHARDRGLGCTAVIRERGVVRGIVGLNPIDPRNREAEIGYWLCSEAEGRGVMTRSAQALIAHGFDSLELNRVTLRAAMGNARSRAVAARLGFVEEGIAREAELRDGRYHDLMVHSLLRRE